MLHTRDHRARPAWGGAPRQGGARRTPGGGAGGAQRYSQPLTPTPALAGVGTGTPASIASPFRFENATAMMSTTRATPAMVNRAGSLSRRLMMAGRIS